MRGIPKNTLTRCENISLNQGVLKTFPWFREAFSQLGRLFFGFLTITPQELFSELKIFHIFWGTLKVNSTNFLIKIIKNTQFCGSLWALYKIFMRGIPPTSWFGRGLKVKLDKCLLQSKKNWNLKFKFTGHSVLIVCITLNKIVIFF